MTQNISAENAPNSVLAFSLERPVLVMLILYFIAWLFKLLDNHILRLDELLGEAILTKSLGFLLVAAYVWACGRKLSDIGFHTRFLGKTLLIAGVSVVSLYLVAYTAQVVQLRVSGEDVGFVLSAIDPRTGMSGGLGFAIWLLSANLVNSAMEEGLFRGTMVRHFLIRFSTWGALLLQASLFSLWHLNWPIRQLLDGKATIGEAAFEAIGLLLGTFIGGLVYGYLYFKTDNLWGAFLAHTINNSIFNVLFIRTSAGMQSGLEFGLFLAIFLIGHVLLIPLIYWFSKRLEMPEVKPWGKFGEDTVSPRLAV
jgi:membrane protease YdiL (CAAX protease family)